MTIKIVNKKRIKRSSSKISLLNADKKISKNSLRKKASLRFKKFSFPKIKKRKDPKDLHIFSLLLIKTHKKLMNWKKVNF